MSEQPVLPDYAGACTSNVMNALLDGPDDPPAWMPSEVAGADQVVLLVVDGLGWTQMLDRLDLLPNIARLARSRITTVCPTTTATALTSITSGLTPGEHGVMGYRMHIRGEVLNVLRWSTGRGDARESIDPLEVQPNEAFGGQRPPVVTRAEFIATGFTEAHLHPVRFVGYRMPSTMCAEAERLLNEGEPFVYVYYDGIDKVAHEYGLGDFYAAELAAVDRIVGYLANRLPPGAALVVTSDHGQVDVGDHLVRLPPEVLALVASMSGEGRFRWLHAVPGGSAELAARCADLYEDSAWVVTRDQVIDEGWFGPTVTASSRALLGDVALVPFRPIAFEDPADTGPFVLQSRHGSMTADEVYVPLLVAHN